MSILIIVLDIVTVWGIEKVFPHFSFRYRRGIRIVFVAQILFSLAIVVSGGLMENCVRDYRLFALFYHLFGLMLVIYLPKFLFATFLTIDILMISVNRKKKRTRDRYSRDPKYIFSKCGLVCCLFFSGLIIWGHFFGRYNYTVEKVEITFDMLPPAFDGYKIIQISDVHAGSFAGFFNRFQEVVDIINEQHPDLIVFTGDMVNNFAEELYPLIPIFSQFRAHDGKYAVLGNHDYGGYYRWKTPTDSVANHTAIEQGLAMMDFVLLNNRAVVLSKGSLNRVALVGLENWGIKQRHPKRGDIVQATDSVRDIPFKILLSHDPSFWSDKIESKKDIALTLSGHTHGMQMGVKLKERRYSPAKYLYRYWAGLYQENNSYLYVNRGLGIIGFPGRIGMSPEITVLILRKSDN